MLFKFPKVELHVHVDGAARLETIWELAKSKSIDLGVSSLEALRDEVVTTTPSSLDRLLQAFYVFMPALIGDVDAIERVAFELCEEQKRQGVVYFEGRFSPHFFSNTHQSETMKHRMYYNGKGPVSPDAVVRAVLRGFDRGERVFGVKARAILCCIRAHPTWSREVLELVKKYRNQGVVGIDIAGCAHAGAEEKTEMDRQNVFVFQEAKLLGIHRTVHAGESGTADDAIRLMFAERIGHGYRVLQDRSLYADMLREDVHFEVCPISSRCTGAVTGPFTEHPARTFADDNVNFGLNTDDPTVLGTWLDDDLRVARDEIGLSERQIWQCERKTRCPKFQQLNAAKSSFLPDHEKQTLIETIEDSRPL